MLAAVVVGCISFIAVGRSDQTGSNRGVPVAARSRSTTSTSLEDPFVTLDDSFRGQGPKVAILGDSITKRSEPALRQALHNRSIWITALQGEGLSGGPWKLLGSSLMVKTADKLRLLKPDVVVIALGTNDAWSPKLTQEAAESAWIHITDELADSCIVAVTVTENSNAKDYDTAEAKYLNHLKRTDADVIVDWGSLGQGNRYTGKDGIHPTQAGEEHFAELVSHGVDQCLSKQNDDDAHPR